GGDIVIEQQQNGRWYRFLQPNCLPKNFPQTLIEPYTHWVAEDGSNLLIQDTQFNACFYSNSSGIHPEGQKDKTLAESDVFTDSCFEKFENLSMLRGWMDNLKKVTNIDIPRYDLHFKLKSNDYISDEFPDYHVGQNQDLSHLAYIPSYLILEN